MINFYYENQGTITYLVYKIKDADPIDSMSLGMLTNNKIPGLAPALYTQMDMEKFIKYNVTAKISVSQFFDGAVNRKRLLGVFNGIVDAMLSAEDFMIDVRTILLDMNYIFTDVSTCDTVLICLPILNSDQDIDLSTFFKNIMFNTQFDQTENCDHVARIINYLNSAPVFSLHDFKGVLESIDNGGAMPTPQKTNVAVSNPQVQYVQQPVTQQSIPQQPVQQQPIQQNIPQSVQQQQPVQFPVQKVNVSTAQVISAQQQLGMQQQTQQPVQQPVQPQQNQGAPVLHPSRRLSGPPPQQMYGNVTVPGAQPVKQAQNQTADTGEKPMSFLTLMMHYNKENKEKYNAQKKAKKAGQSQAPQVSPGVAVPQKQVSSASFDIPGQAAMAVGSTVTQVNVTQQVAQPQPAQQVQIPQQQMKQAQYTTTAYSPQQQAQPAYAQSQVQIQQMNVPESTMQGSRKNFGNTTVLGDGKKKGDTTVLGEAQGATVQARPHLIRIKTQEHIYLDRPTFKLGKERSFVDYFIGDNPAVSRSHATISCQDGQYFVTDTNSTNHTYVNGGMIQSNIATPLSHGTKIRLANEEFEFRLN